MTAEQTALSVVIIPAYQPNRTLFDLVESLVITKKFNVIVVDDGSSESSSDCFSSIKKFSQVIVLRHDQNYGKGRALRTGISYYLANCSDQSSGVITADADGQHTVADIIAINEEHKKYPQSLSLGTRKFHAAIPIRSYLGNQITRFIFRFFVGKKLKDTQTGLRAIPKSFLPKLLNVNSSGYEFELEMLIKAIQNEISFHEVPIQTIYEDGNRTSHFNPLTDSFKIYFVFFRFLTSSLLSALVDLAVFTICFLSSQNILLSLVVARLVAGSFNFTVARSLVFKSTAKTFPQILKFISLVLFLLATSYASMIFLVEILGLNIFLSKIISEGILFFFSFTIQNSVVFKSLLIFPTASNDNTLRNSKKP